MTNRASNSPVVAKRCWSCHGEIDPTDSYCRHCGVNLKQESAPSMAIHRQLVSIEKMLLKTAIGVALVLVLIGWLLLQTYHFGKRGFMGDLRTQKFGVALIQETPRSLLQSRRAPHG
jgi:hypothetical protein